MPDPSVGQSVSPATRVSIRHMAAELKEAEAIPPEKFPGHKGMYCANLVACLGRYALPLLNALERAESEWRADVTEALDAIDKHAERDLDHELHAIVEHYRKALNV